MTLVPYKSFGLFDDMDRLFSNLYSNGRSENGLSSWTPAVDIKEEEKRYLIRADIPGVNPKDIEITFDNGVLSIHGERKLENEEEKDGYKRVERAYGSFSRQFSLPDSVDAEKISAKGNHGVLEISVPKSEKAQPKKISVS